MNAFAAGLEHPRWLLVLPNGDVLVAQAKAPPSRERELRAVILEIVVSTGKTRVFASGLRNPVGMDFEPQTSALWTVANERDELGSDLVPDYLTSVKDGGFYGWPYSYFGRHLDRRVEPQRPDLVAKAIVPDYAFGNHVAPPA